MKKIALLSILVLTLSLIAKTNFSTGQSSLSPHPFKHATNPDTRKWILASLVLGFTFFGGWTLHLINVPHRSKRVQKTYSEIRNAILKTD